MLYRNKYSFVLKGQKFGKYHIEIIDSNGVLLSKDFVIGTDLFTHRAQIYNFNVNNIDKININNTARDMYLGGYIDVNVNISPEYKDIVKDTVKIEIVNDNESIVQSGKWGETITIYAKKAGVPYNLYLSYDCTDSNLKSKGLFLDTLYVKDGRDAGLHMGWKRNQFFLTITPNNKHLITPPADTFDPVLNFGDNGEWWNKK
jgi:hypothetical protein